MKFMLEYMQVQLISSLIHNDYPCFLSQIILKSFVKRGGKENWESNLLESTQT